MEVHFYEKPGCINNTKQKQLLENMGHIVVAHSILTTAWTEKKLQNYFNNLEVKDWFNMSAPQIKNGKLNPTTFNETTALEVMLANPLLIRRPLIAANGKFACGFDNKLVESLLVNIDLSHLQKCPNISSENSCERF